MKRHKRLYGAARRKKINGTLQGIKIIYGIQNNNKWNPMQTETSRSVDVADMSGVQSVGQQVARSCLHANECRLVHWQIHGIPLVRHILYRVDMHLTYIRGAAGIKKKVSGFFSHSLSLSILLCHKISLVSHTFNTINTSHQKFLSLFIAWVEDGVLNKQCVLTSTLSCCTNLKLNYSQIFH